MFNCWLLKCLLNGGSCNMQHPVLCGIVNACTQYMQSAHQINDADINMPCNHDGTNPQAPSVGRDSRDRDAPSR
jgi:hypothetical protein